MRVVVGAALVGLMLAGCGSGSSPHPTASASATAAAPAPRGLVGTIDRARLLAVCENTRTADTALAAGDTTTADNALSSAVTLLLKPPVDADAQAAGQVAQRFVTQGHGGQAVAALTTFCRKHNA